MPYRWIYLRLDDMLARGRTWVGRVRSRNEDVYTVRPEFGFAAIADGMGGTSAGHIAARIAVDEVSDHLYDISRNSDISAADLADAVEIANKKVYERGQTYADFTGMGTTIVLLIANANQGTLCHVGDSRAYLFRQNEMHQLTKDHSLVQEKVDRGEMTAQQARFAYNRNIVTRALGPTPYVEPEITEQAFETGDVVLMCTDGLSDFVEEPELLEIVAAHSDNLDSTLSILIETADRRGSTDNITAVLTKVEE